ncbi:MAG: ABC transporter permease, partial [Deltaproteobacteria bacterium]|nr:ABC transporter permease [Deltaproteobacteria bacterium]
MRMQRIAAVARFEFLSVVKRWSYLIATFGLPIFLAVVSGTVLGAQTYFLTQRAAESSQFGLVDESGVIDRAVFEQRDGARVWTANGNDVVLYDNGDVATSDLESGRLRAVYIVAKNYLSSGEVRAIQSDKTPLLSMSGTTIEPLLRSLLRKSLVEGRLDGDVQERVISPAYFIRSRLGPEGEEVTGVDEALDLLVRTTIPLFLGILLLTALLSASGYLVQTVSTDKESKIVEVLLSSVTPEEILAGKLFGLGAAGLVQFAVWSSMVVFVALSASAALASVVTIPWQALAVAPLLFILGYLFLGSLMLATAALGANAAESQKLTMGWAMLAILPLMVLVILLEAPNGTLGQIMTWIPFTSPLTVIIRLAVDPSGIAWWEVIGAMGVLVVSTWLSIRVGARLFRVGFLLTGSMPSLA